MLRKATILGLACASILGGRSVGQTTTRVSVDSLGNQANGGSMFPAITPDARYVVFQSGATNLVPGDTNGQPDVFVHDLQTGATMRVSVDSSGNEANGYCAPGVITPDGRFVAFMSGADNLVTGDTNSAYDVFVRDLVAGQTTRASLDASGAEFPMHTESVAPCISADGRYVAFQSYDDTQSNSTAIYVRDVVAGTTSLVSVDPSGMRAIGLYTPPSISGDGRYVVFASDASNLVAGDTNGEWDGFVRDLQTGTTVLVSVDTSGMPSAGGAITATISADGRFVLFDSVASDLVTGDTNGQYDAFLRDLVLGRTERISLDSSGGQGNDFSTIAEGDFVTSSLSDDARYVAFWSVATNLAPNDTNGFPDVFVRDRTLGITTRENLGPLGEQTTDYTDDPSLAIAQAGRYLVFSSESPILVAGDTNGFADIFVRDRMPADVASFCLGDGSGAACPCGNSGAPNRGCENSSSTGGCVLAATGVASLGADTLRITSFGERASVLSVFMQSDATVGPFLFGDGLRCIGGSLKRLYAHSASLGVVTVPVGADLSISARSAALGDVIAAGTARHYQVHYRDPVAAFCPMPPGDNWNVSNALSAVWTP